MRSDTAVPDEHPDLEGGAAAFQPVTDEMMDHAARAAAAQAEGVARGTVAPASAAPERAEAAVTDAADAARGAAERSAEVVRDAATEAAAAAVQVSDEAMDVARQASREASATAERTADAARAGLSAAGDAVAQYNAKVSEMVRANLASTTSLFAALVQAKSIPEALSLNAEHLRRQMDVLTSQGRELASLAQRIALDALQPPKGPAGR